MKNMKLQKLTKASPTILSCLAAAAAEELTKTDYCAGLKKVSTVGLAMIAGALTYKYVVIPAATKIKTWHENHKVKNQPDDVIDGAFEEVENEKTTE